MPNEITAQLSVEFVNPKSLGANRELIFNAQLNEGFDRAHWKLLISSAERVWVPVKSGMELAAGLYMAATHVSKEPFPFPVLKNQQAVDLNRSPEFPEEDALKWAAEKLKDHVICLMVFSDSSLKWRVIEGLPQGFDFRIFQEATEPKQA